MDYVYTVEDQIRKANEIIDRIKDFLNLDSDSDLNRLLKVSSATVSTWRKRGKIPYELIVTLCDSSGANIRWLLNGEGNKYLEDEINEYSIVESEYVRIPKVKAKVSAGHGRFVDLESDQIIDWMMFKKSYITNYLNADPKKCILVKAEGDSMEPDIKSGDLLLVNTGDRKPKDGLFVIYINETLMVKHFEMLLNGKIRISSYNEAYSPLDIDPGEIGDLRIIGRVRQHSRTIF